MYNSCVIVHCSNITNGHHKAKTTGVRRTTRIWWKLKFNISNTFNSKIVILINMNTLLWFLEADTARIISSPTHIGWNCVAQMLHWIGFADITSFFHLTVIHLVYLYVCTHSNADILKMDSNILQHDVKVSKVNLYIMRLQKKIKLFLAHTLELEQHCSR